jgi:hypothetical protein
MVARKRERIICFLIVLTETDIFCSYNVYLYFSYALVSRYSITSKIRLNFTAFFRTVNKRRVIFVFVLLYIIKHKENQVFVVTIWYARMVLVKIFSCFRKFSSHLLKIPLAKYPTLAYYFQRKPSISILSVFNLIKVPRVELVALLSDQGQRL